MKKFEEYLNKMIEAETEEERQEIKAEFDLHYSDLKNKAEFIEFTKQKTRELRNQLRAMDMDAPKSITIGVKSYSLKEWIPIKDYCLRTGEKPAKISLRISRGTMDNGKDYIEIPELNNLKLINVNYKSE